MKQPEPDSETWTCASRAEQLIAESGLWWLSFVVAGKFAGVVVAPGRSAADAIRATHASGCNPGGEIAFRDVPANLLTDAENGPVWQRTPRLVLLDKAALLELGHI